MHTDLQLAILGTGTGALYGLLAAGLIVIFRSSGVLNFAQATLATLAAYTHLYLHQQAGLAVPLSAALAILLAVAIGAVFQMVVMRALRNAPPLAKVVATLGVLLAGTAAVQPIFGDRSPPATPLFDYGALELPFGNPRFLLPWNQVWIIAITAALFAALWLTYRFTSFGRLTRAAAANRRATEALGHSTQRVEFANWLIGSGLAGVAGVLLSSLVGPTSLGYLNTLTPAVAAALIGGFQSFALTLVAALLIGSGQSVLLLRSTDLENATHVGGWGAALPLVAVIAATLLVRKRVALKETFDRQRLPWAPRLRRSPVMIGAVALLVGVLWYAIIPASLADPTTKSLISALLAMSLVVVTGYAGQVSLAQCSLAGFGAFWAAKCAAEFGIPFPLTVVIAGVSAIPLGLAMGAASLRVRGTSLAIVTLGAALVMDAMFFSSRALTGADSGMRVEPARIGALGLNGLNDAKQFGIAVLTITVLVAMGIVWIRSGRLGARFLAVRANERGAAASGISVARTKMIAFGISSLVAGVAGSLEGYRSIQLSWGAFSFFASILLFAFAYLGGITSISGAVVAGLMMQGGLLDYVLHFEGKTGQIVQIVAGLGLVQIVATHPEGLSLLPYQLADVLRRRRRQRTVALPDVEARQT
ncbi:ABC transporter permease [Dactylosporangium sp. NPDC051485]|uniref:branched-chain amino acid ABC transporter permease n=1 Tax=Dactylosporangium sp. NPDC051485 TaxID=3154846 RepID=UPI00343D020E